MIKINSVTKPRSWFTALLVAGFVAGCGAGTSPILGGGGKGTSAPVIPSVPVIIPGAVCSAGSGPTIPTVTLSDPTSGNQFATTSTNGVAGGGKWITATFSQAMNAATITQTSFTLQTVGGPLLTPASVTYNASTNVATLTTTSALLPNISYTASITTAVTSAAVPGVPIACSYAWTFKTVTPVATGLAPVNMGLAAPFGISATTGLNTAISSSTVNADVLLDPVAGAKCNTTAVPANGTIGTCLAIGFPPNINGTVISPLFTGGRNLANIRTDLNAAYLSITPPAGPPAAGSLGGAPAIAAPTTLGAATGSALVVGQNLFYPGVYQSITSILIKNDLTLDAQGNPDAVFVFQSSSSIGTAAGAAPPGGTRTRILLVNGTKASNVWWQAASSATVDTYDEFQGNILAAITITLNNGATSCGRMIAGAWVGGGGAITLGGANVVSVPGQPFAPPAGYSTTCQ